MTTTTTTIIRYLSARVMARYVQLLRLTFSTNHLVLKSGQLIANQI